MSTDTYAPANGQHTPDRPLPADVFPPDVAFGTGATQVVPHEWAAWILTAMRDEELAQKKPKAFSAWLAACVMANR